MSFDLMASGDGMPPRTPVVGFLSTVVVSNVPGEHANESKVINPNKILFVFLATAAGRSDDPSSARISAKWIGRTEFEAEAVYIRTAEGIYRSGYRTLTEFRKQSPVRLEIANRSVLVNPLVVQDFERRTRIRKLEFYVAPGAWSWSPEYVHVGRRYARHFRTIFGIARGQHFGGA